MLVLIFPFHTAQKMKNFKKNKKSTWRYHNFTQLSKNHDHMLYCSWGMVCDGCNCYFSFWAIFCPPPLTARKMNFSKKMKNEKKKKHLEISFYTSVPKIMICCTVPEIWCVTDEIIFHFGLFFALSPP